MPSTAIVRPLRALVGDVSARLRRHDLALAAAGLTFFAGIALVPLLLVALRAAGAIIGEDTVVELVERVAAYAPSELGLRERVVELGEAGPTLGTGPLLWALVPATTYGEGLVRAFDRFSETDRRAKSLRGRVLALAILALFPVLVVFGLGAVAVLPEILGDGFGARVLGVYLTFWVGWIASTALLVVTYRAFSPHPLTFRALLWGGASAGSFLTGMSLGWLLVLRFGVDVGQAYGGSALLGTIVLFAVYLFLVQVVCLTGYVVTLEMARRGGRVLAPEGG